MPAAGSEEDALSPDDIVPGDLFVPVDEDYLGKTIMCRTQDGTLHEIPVDEVLHTTNPSGSDSEDDYFGGMTKKDAAEQWRATVKQHLEEGSPITENDKMRHRLEYRAYRRELRRSHRGKHICAAHGEDPRIVCGKQGVQCPDCTNYYCRKHAKHHVKGRCPASEAYQSGSTLSEAIVAGIGQNVQFSKALQRMRKQKHRQHQEERPAGFELGGDRLRRLCIYCSLPASSNAFLRCCPCRQKGIRYCSKRCQIAHWPTHRKECGAARSRTSSSRASVE